MGSCSNVLLAIINLITFLFSIPILLYGIFLAKVGTTECAKFFETPLIAIGCIMMILSLIGAHAACCRSSGLLCLYMILMMLLIVCLFCITMFALAATHEATGQALAGKGYNEYRLDYNSKTMDEKNWAIVGSCLVNLNFCTGFAERYANHSVDEYTKLQLQSGCCKPSDECKFTSVRPGVWKKDNGVFENPDCHEWDENPGTMCYNCQSCKAGVLAETKSYSLALVELNTMVLACVVLVLMIACCASTHNTSSMDAARMQSPYLQDPYAQYPYPPNPYGQSPYPPHPYAYQHLRP